MLFLLNPRTSLVHLHSFLTIPIFGYHICGKVESTETVEISDYSNLYCHLQSNIYFT